METYTLEATIARINNNLMDNQYEQHHLICYMAQSLPKYMGVTNYCTLVLVYFRTVGAADLDHCFILPLATTPGRIASDAEAAEQL
ncbi:MAG: hypothetical protein O8C61_00290 [Candidatus Methanoperedens sp.]|nr:hypothetical protein [Candidatus Methanoperedens sp.]